MTKNTLESAIDIHLSRGINIGCEVFVWWNEQLPRLDGLTGIELDNEEWQIRLEMVELPAWKAVQANGAYDALVSIPRPQIEPRKTQVEMLYITKLLQTYVANPMTRSLIRNLIGRAASITNFLSPASLAILTNFDANTITKDARTKKAKKVVL
jgi:hypothetical protein